ncbi:hypothetical protein ASPBRDRAFT_124962, partial [Aspergillus brasiliensis CBS 101740]
ELDGLVEARQKLESQQQENVGVQKEFESLDDESNIYKLIGPVLLKQEKTEALMAVNGRLEFIEKEMCRIEGQIEENQDKADKKRAEVSFVIVRDMRSAIGFLTIRGTDRSVPDPDSTAGGGCFCLNIDGSLLPVI